MKPSPPPIPIAHPCQADWHAMTGDDRRRLCALCDKHVHNLSALPPRDLERFVQNRDGTECIAYVVREDGTMVTTPRCQPVRKLARGIAWFLALLLPTLFSGCAQRMATSGSRMLRGTPVPGRPATPMERTVHPSSNGKMLLGEVPASPRPTDGSRNPATRP